MFTYFVASNYNSKKYCYVLGPSQVIFFFLSKLYTQRRVALSDFYNNLKSENKSMKKEILLALFYR